MLHNSVFLYLMQINVEIFSFLTNHFNPQMEFVDYSNELNDHLNNICHYYALRPN